MLSLLVEESTIPESDPPPAERREVGRIAVERDLPPSPLADEGPPPSELESRPPAMPIYTYSRDQSMGQDWENDRGHVRIGRHRPDATPDSEHEPSIYPQRPTFRAPPEPWYAGAVDSD